MSKKELTQDEINQIHQAMAIEIMEEISKGNKMSASVNHDNILDLIEKIKEKEQNYLYCHSNLKNENEEKIANFSEQQKIIYEPIFNTVKQSCEFDIPLFKIGQCCGSWRQRNGIIGKRALFSTKNGYKDFRKDKAKDKTKYLPGSIITLEKKENIKRNAFEWQIEDYEYRMIIEYLDKKTLKDTNKKEYKQIILYFKTLEEMDLARQLLFGNDSSDDSIVNNLKIMKKSINDSFTFYGILKLLSVKEQIKKRKRLLGELKDLSNQHITGFINFGKKYTNGLNRYIYFSQNKEIKMDPIIGNSSVIERNKAVPVRNKRRIQNEEEKVTPFGIDHIPSHFNPIITSLPNNDSTWTSRKLKDNDDDNSFKTCNEMNMKIKQLKKAFPNDLNDNFDNENNNNLEFLLNGNVIVENKNKNNEVMDKDKVKNTKEISINKKRPEIVFENEEGNKDTMDKKNIYDISNVILNCNNKIKNGVDENNLVILGPKINNDTYFNYKYNDGKNNFYVDPEKYGLKFNNGDLGDKKKNLNCLQIFQLKYRMNQNKLNDLAKKANEKNINININNPEDDFYFYHKVNLGYNLKKKSDLVKATKYENEHFIVEFNNEYYYMLDELENKPIKIECYCIPKECFSNDEQEENKKFLVDYMNPYFLGETIITKENIDENKYEYPLFDKNENQLPEKTRLLILTFEDYSKEKPMNGIQGKDYTIGYDSYVVKLIDKEVIVDAENRCPYGDDIKDEYYSVRYDNKENILFRPPNDMILNDFKNDIINQINDYEMEGIEYNSKFKYLPQCEKFENREKLYASKNLSCLTEDEKEDICLTKKKGDWIYKSSELKVRMLSRNLGISDNNNKINQLNYFTCTHDKFRINDFEKRKKMYPINENKFNLFNMKNLEPNTCENFDNYQWKVGIKFNNEDQMKTFVKELENLRQRVNLNYENDESKKITYQKTLDHCPLPEGAETGIMNCNIESIILRDDFKLKDNSTLELSVEIGKNLYGKHFLEYLKEDNFDYENTLLEIEDVRDKYDQIKDMKSSTEPIDLSQKINMDKFNSEEHKIFFKQDDDFQVQKTGNYINLNITFRGDSGRYNEELYAPVKINTKADYNVCPIYRKGNTDRILGSVVIDVWDPKEKKGFFELFKEINKNYLIKGEFYGKDKIPLSHGFYEPNVFRRKILKVINKNNSANINKIHSYLEIECAKDFDLSNFDFTNVKRDNSIDIYNNTYPISLGIKTLKNQKKEEFFELYAEKEWNLYIKDFFKNKKNIDFSELDDNFTLLYDKRNEIFNKEKSEKNLRTLMYLGIPTYKGRKIIWETLLDIHKLFELTYKKMKEDHNELDDLLENDLPINEKLEEEEKIKEEIYDICLQQKDLNIVFSLIDNDINYIQENDINKIKQVKVIAKAFYVWTQKNISLSEIDKKKKDIRYIYFTGVLPIIYKLNLYFKKPYETFWMLIGLSQYIDLFQQENPFYSQDMSYINLYVLVTRLIIENHYKELYDKFLSLNYPIEFFLSKNIGSLFSDYFARSLTLNLFDILIYESTFSKTIYNDRLQYLRVLCTVPITLMSLKRKDILACKSVSELEVVFKDLIVESYNIKEFTDILSNNVTKFFTCTIFEKFFSFLNLNKDVEWDNKRDKIEKAIYYHFNQIRTENEKYLKSLVNKDLIYNRENFFNQYMNELEDKLNDIKKVYELHSINNYGIFFRIDKLKPILYNKNILIPQQLKIDVIFSGAIVNITNNQLNPDFNQIIDYDNDNFEINNKQDLIFIKNFNDSLPKILNIIIRDNNNKPLLHFAYNLFRFDIMNMDKIVIESLNNEREAKKFLLEIELFKSCKAQISKESILLHNTIFSAPEYYHDIQIENELNSYYINSSNAFNNEIETIIKRENEEKNSIIINSNYDENLQILFKKYNNITEKVDQYNEKSININKDKGENDDIIVEIKEILMKLLDEEKVEIFMNWFNESNISFEEILYIIILMDSNIFMISEKMFLLFKIAQTRNNLLFHNDRASISKIKEMIYALYKRFMIYFNKNEVNRMIDFILKDEKLYNIKYALIYDSNKEDEINDIIYNIKNYNPTINEQNIGEKEIYDSISTKLNAYINYCVNHYNMKSISQSILKEILKQIIKENEKYKEKNLNTIKLVIVKDNITYEMNYEIQYNPLEIIRKENETNPTNDNIDKILCKEISNLEISNSYELGDENTFDCDITFFEFRNIFFKLPFLSDLLRISLSYMSSPLPLTYEAFKSLTLAFYFNDQELESFTFKNGPENENVINLLPTKMNCVYDLLDTINHKTSSSELNSEIKNSLFIPNIFECRLDNGEIILPFESFYSNHYLNTTPNVKINIIYHDNEITFHSQKLINKIDGYSKILLDNNSKHFEWKKAKITEDSKEIVLNSLDYKFKYHSDPSNLIEEI